VETVVDLRGVDLNLLVALEALLVEESVTKAAQRMNVGQSTMSATLARLRRHFNDELLVKHGRNLVATPAGRSLLPSLQRILQQTESLLSRQSTFNPEEDSRDFYITSNDYIATVFLRPLIAALHQETPRTRLHVTATQETFEDSLRKGEAELVIAPREVLRSNVDFPNEFLFADRYVAAVDADNSEVGDSLTLDQFTRQPYLAVNVGHRATSAELQLDARGIRRNTRITTESFVLAPLLLRGTPLITLVPELLGKALQKQAGIRLLKPPMPLRPIHMIMLWPERNSADAATAWLRNRMMRLSKTSIPS
jgi:DNA-binding transcriptional LysR family regulator